MNDKLMTPSVISGTFLLLASCLCVTAQGTIVFDQQSSTNESPLANGTGTTLQQYSSYGQSFTPSLSSLDFVRLNVNDPFPGFGGGATMHVNVRSSSISGAILGSSLSVIMPDGFSGVTNFDFASSLVLLPGTTYYIEPIVDSGDQWNIIAGEFNYSGGMVFANGNAAPGSDIWFREGIIIPEPSVSWILIMGTALLVNCRMRKRQRHK